MQPGLADDVFLRDLLLQLLFQDLRIGRADVKGAQVLAVAQHRVQEALAEGIQLLEELGGQQRCAAKFGILGEQFADIRPAEGLELVDRQEHLAALLERHGLLQAEAAPQQVDQGAAQDIHTRVIHIAARERAQDDAALCHRLVDGRSVTGWPTILLSCWLS